MHERTCATVHKCDDSDVSAGQVIHPTQPFQHLHCVSLSLRSSARGPCIIVNHHEQYFFKPQGLQAEPFLRDSYEESSRARRVLITTMKHFLPFFHPSIRPHCVYIFYS